MKKVNIKYMLTLIIPFIVNYNLIAFVLLKVNCFVDYLKLPYWIINIVHYIDYIDNNAYQNIFNSLAFFDLYKYGPIICVIIALTPLILVIIKQCKLKDFLLFYIAMCLNLMLFAYVYNHLFYIIYNGSSYFTGIETIIVWIYTSFIAFVLLCSTLLLYFGFKMKKNYKKQ